MTRQGLIEQLQYMARRNDSVDIRDDGSIYLWTATNRYKISAEDPTEQKPLGYLGCIATNRSWDVGEDWHRGNDLADGPLNEETLRYILRNIVGFEMLSLFPGADGMS